METMEAILSRRSVKRFQPKLPPRADIEKVVEAGLYAASGMDRQSPVILVVTDRAARDEMAADNARIGNRTEGDPFYGAPVVLVVLADKSVPTGVYDGSLTLGNMMLAAHALGLGSCWIHRAREEFESPKWRDWLRAQGVSGDYEGVGHLALGYPEGEYPQTRPRRENRVYYVE